jgi:hypothetical protein
MENGTAIPEYTQCVREGLGELFHGPGPLIVSVLEIVIKGWSWVSCLV